jgi:hypothetical protein
VRELYIFYEGATEQGFCKQLLEPHLFAQHDGTIHAIEIVHSRHHGRVSRGGVPGRYETMQRQILGAVGIVVGRDLSARIMSVESGPITGPSSMPS